ncbi:MAG: hypothetical protein JNK67_17240 [Alphaproteobacteria bacterium]|nr:hypothetical protein [Alphaproteobacteria bacterium]
MSTLARLRDGIGARLRALSPQARRAARENERLRAQGLARLAGFARGGTAPLFRKPLIDGQWDNANYWIRIAMVMRALGIDGATATGLLGRFSRARVDAAFAAFGIAGRADHGVHFERRAEFLAAARRLLATARSPGDLLALELPGGLPPALVYDGILKRQRRAAADLADPELPMMLAEALASIDVSEAILAREAPDLVLLSHALDFTYGALAWAALKRGIPVIALYGDYGVARFIRMTAPDALFSVPNRPMRSDDGALDGAQAAALEAAGAAYVDARLGGRTDDVGAIYAFKRRTGQVSRSELCAHYGWDAAKPVIAVYAPNWFDYPHSSDRMPFRDFLEWAERTLAVARATSGVNWLFKAHPCDEWYGTIHGKRLADLIAASPVAHVGLADTRWNGADLLRAVDGLTTFHGTGGIEAASLGKPVLVPYAGWYGDLGFAVVADGRDDYLQRLATRWWDGHDPEAARRRAHRFAGWYFCVPDWHGGYALHDDANQDAIWWDLDPFLDAHGGELDRDIGLLRGWMASPARYFHVYKMAQAAGYAPPRARQSLDGDPRRRQLAGAGGA